LASFKCMLKRGLGAVDIQRYNIMTSDDELDGRLIIPSYNESNQLNHYSARDLSGDQFPRYIESNAKKGLLVGFENLLNFDLPVTLVEGAMDAITVRHNTIPLFCSFLTKKIRSILLERRPPRVNIALDGEAYDHSIHIANTLFKDGHENLYVVKFPEGQDPNSLGYKKTWEYINNAKKVDLEFLLAHKLHL
jgi:hypothetical protein